MWGPLLKVMPGPPLKVMLGSPLAEVMWAVPLVVEAAGWLEVQQLPLPSLLLMVMKMVRRSAHDSKC